MIVLGGRERGKRSDDQENSEEDASGLGVRRVGRDLRAGPLCARTHN